MILRPLPRLPQRQGANIDPRRVAMNGMRVPSFFRLSLVLCGLLVSAPFLNPYHGYPLLTFHTEWLALALGLAALAAIALALSRAAVPIPGLCTALHPLPALLVL